jgi:hypothetical protein
MTTIITDLLDQKRDGERESVRHMKTAPWIADWSRLRRPLHSWRGCLLRITEGFINSHIDMLISSRSSRRRIHNMLAGMINL